MAPPNNQGHPLENSGNKLPDKGSLLVMDKAESGDEQIACALRVQQLLRERARQ